MTLPSTVSGARRTVSYRYPSHPFRSPRPISGRTLPHKHKGELRLPNVQEREITQGLSSDYTLNCLPKWEQGGQFHIDTRLTLLGLPCEYQAGDCLTNKKVGAAAPENTGTRSYLRVSEWLYPQLSPEQGEQFHIDTRLTLLGLPDQYQAGHCLINIKGERRLPNAQEREVILGFLSDYTLNSLPKWEQGGQFHIDTRLTLLGLPYRYQAGHCLTSKKGEAAAPECTGTQSYPRVAAWLAWLYPQLSPHKETRRAVSYRYSSRPFR